jgi:6-pyruvoyltetrahydropterin/6-carboxytetrahydropterin synthase
MAVIRISKEFNFDMAHALLGYDGLCRNIHGHSYTLVVTVTGTPLDDPASPKNGMLIDFKDLKAIIREAIIQDLDHALLINRDTPEELLDMLTRHYEKVKITPYQPTTENLIADLAGRVISLLPPDLKLYSLRLRETDTSYAEWFAGDNEQ